MTEMRDLDELLPKVAEWARNVPDTLAIRHLAAASRAFCAASKMWSEDDRFTVAAPSFEALVRMSDADVLEIETAFLDDLELTPVSRRDLDRTFPGWRTAVTTETSTARFVTQLEPNTITLYPAQTGTLRLGLVMQTSSEAMAAPGWLIDQYGSDVARGAAATLLELPNTDWSNPDAGVRLGAKFDRARSTAARLGKSGQQKARIRTKGNFF